MYFDRVADDNSSALPAVRALLGSLGLTLLAGVLVAALVSPVIALGGATLNSTVGLFDSLPSEIEIDRQPQQNRIFATNNGETVQIATIFDQNREEVAWDQVSEFAKDAAVSGEDRRFYEHGGIDPTGIVRAALKNVARGGISEGASTISQQYVKNTFIQAALELPDKAAQDAAYNAAVDDTFERKLNEMKLAISLEKRYTKQEILLAYLNIANFGGTTYGIEAAARRYYNTTALNLTAAQAASLVAIVQSPGVRSLNDPANFPANLERRNVILAGMLADGKLTPEQYGEAVATPVDGTTVTLVEQSNGCMVANDHARFFCDYVRNLIKDLPALGADAASREAAFRHGGYDFMTTLDLGIQATSQDAVWTNAPNDTSALELGSSAVSVEVGTGRILAMSQNKLYNNTQEGAGPEATAVNFSTDKAYGGSSGFQPGSTYKVFTLLNWLQSGHGLNEVVNGSPRTEASSAFTDSCGGPWGGPFPFKNDDATSGPMSVARATQLSVNGAFVSMALDLDLCNIKSTAASIGVHRADGSDLQSNPSSVLGTNEIAPLTMAGAYAAIAAQGVYCVPIAIDRIVAADGSELPGQEKNCSQQLEPSVANTAAFAMAKVVTDGTATRSDPNNGVEYIAKTGTSDSSNHTWVVGSSTRVATAVWVGNIQGFVPIRSYQNTLGVAGGAIRHDIFRTVAEYVDTTASYRGGDFPPPDPKLLRGTGETVPSVNGLGLSSAKSALARLGFVVREGGSIASALPPGLAVSTSPPAGTLLPQNSSVTVYTSDGSLAEIARPDEDSRADGTITMLNVVGNGYTSEDDARDVLNRAGFTNLDDVCVEVSDEDREDTVISTSPGAGTALQPDDPIVLNIGDDSC